MRAVVFEEFGGPVDVRSVADPTPSPGGVVVEVHATGLCRSDWHGWAGHDDGVPLPHVPGHELVGVIAAIGADVRRWTVGDRVTTPFVCGCGTCQWCADGHAQVCPDQTQPGFTHWGSFADFVALHAADTNLFAVPDTVGDAAAAPGRVDHDIRGGRRGAERRADRRFAGRPRRSPSTAHRMPAPGPSTACGAAPAGVTLIDPRLP